MDDPEQIANLVFFWEERYWPESRLWPLRNRSGETNRLFGSLTLLESFLWFDLGKRMGFFPQEELAQIDKQDFDHFRNAYEVAANSGAIKRFPAPVQRTLEIEYSARRRRYEDYKEVVVRIPEELGVFRSAMLLSDGFALDPEVSNWIKLLVFASAPDWRNKLHSRKSLGTNSQSSGMDVVNGRLYSGFRKIIKYMEDFQSVTGGELERERRQAITSNLSFRIREIQQWRLDFRDEFVSERFLQMMEIVKATLQKQAVQVDGSRLEEGIRALMTQWGAPARGLTASAG